jgi:hypothetical protein
VQEPRLVGRKTDSVCISHKGIHSQHDFHCPLFLRVLHLMPRPPSPNASYCDLSATGYSQEVFSKRFRGGIH